MTTTWYRATTYSMALEPVEVESDTKYMVTIVSKSAGNLRRYKEHKTKEFSGIFPSKRDAYLWKIGRAKKDVSTAEAHLDAYREQLRSYIEIAKADGVDL